MERSTDMMVAAIGDGNVGGCSKMAIRSKNGSHPSPSKAILSNCKKNDHPLTSMSSFFLQFKIFHIFSKQKLSVNKMVDQQCRTIQCWKSKKTRSIIS